MDNDKLYKSFPITSVCRADLQDHYTQEQIDSLDDDDMREIAEKMQEAYTENVFWIDLEIIVENILSDKKNWHHNEPTIISELWCVINYNTKEVI